MRSGPYFTAIVGDCSIRNFLVVVPISNFDISKTPIGPFQMMVLDSATAWELRLGSTADHTKTENNREQKLRPILPFSTTAACHTILASVHRSYSVALVGGSARDCANPAVGTRAECAPAALCYGMGKAATKTKMADHETGLGTVTAKYARRVLI